jgi:carbonic anhydrase
MKKKYKAMVLSCMDPRFQTKVSNYLKRRKLNNKYSAFTIVGAAVGVTASKFKKWHTTFWENLNTSIKIHRIEKLIVINHKDCGAAKIVNGRKEFTPQNEMKIHEYSFEKIKLNLKKKHPRLKVELNLMSLNGRVDKF